MSISKKTLDLHPHQARRYYSLPQSEVQELVRLAELAGTTFSAELVRVLDFFIQTEGGLPDLDGMTMREALAEVQALREPWETVEVELPLWAGLAVRAVALRYSLTDNHALAVLTRKTVHGLLRLEQRGLERGQSLTDVLFGLIAEDVAA